MSFVNKSRNKLDNVKIKSVSEILSDVLKATSGTSSTGVGDDFKIIFNKIIGFRGVRDGLGTSLFVSNLAIALADLGLKICVVDTSMLYPVQDVYLGTEIKKVGAQKNEVKDWFDLMYDSKDVLNISKYSGVVVLSFTDRNLTDLTSISDTLELGQAAIDKMSPQFDLVLVDLANEYTSVGLAAMQACDVIYQVMSNDRASLNFYDSFVSNMLTQAIPYNKMQQVILLSTIDDIMQLEKMGDVLKKYGFIEVARVGLSEVIASENAIGRLPVKTSKIHEDVEEYRMAVASVVKLILNINDMDKEIAGIRVGDIVESNAERLARGTSARGSKKSVVKEEEYYEDEYDDYDYEDEEYYEEDGNYDSNDGYYDDKNDTQSYDSEDYYEDDEYYDDNYEDYDDYDDYEEETPVKKGLFGKKSSGTSSKKEPKKGLFGSKKSKGR